MANFNTLGAVFVVALLAAITYWSMYGNPLAAAKAKAANAMGSAANAMGSANNAMAGALANQGTMVDSPGYNMQGNMGDNGYGGAPDDNVNPAPLGYASYAYTDDNAYMGAFPQSEDSASLTSDGSPGEYDLNLNSLMPAGWSQASGCGAGESDGQWGKFAPNKQQFEQYITASGSARYGMNTRTQNPTGGIQGLTNLIWPVATPVDGAEIPFNDSSFRQDLVYDSLNFYPAQAQC